MEQFILFILFVFVFLLVFLLLLLLLLLILLLFFLLLLLLLFFFFIFPLLFFFLSADFPFPSPSPSTLPSTPSLPSCEGWSLPSGTFDFLVLHLLQHHQQQYQLAFVSGHLHSVESAAFPSFNKWHPSLPASSILQHRRRCLIL